MVLRLFNLSVGHGFPLPSWERDRVKGSTAVLESRQPPIPAFPHKGGRSKSEGFALALPNPSVVACLRILHEGGSTYADRILCYWDWS